MMHPAGASPGALPTGGGGGYQKDGLPVEAEAHSTGIECKCVCVIRWGR